MSRLATISWIAAALALLAGCKTTSEPLPPASPPQLADSRLEITDQTMSSFMAGVSGVVSNPRDVPLRLARVSYELSARGTSLREGTHEISVEVPPNGQASFFVPVSVEKILDMEAYQALFTSAALPVVFQGVVSGTYGSERVELDVNRAGRLRSPRLPEVTLENADGARRTIDQIHATFRVKIDNDNPFETRITAINYVLEVEGEQLREDRVGFGQRLPPSGAYVFTIEQELTPQTVPGLDEVMKERNSVHYRLHGTVVVDDLELPFDEKAEIRFAGQRR